MGEPIRVLVVDDHPLFRRGLAATLAATGEFEVVGEAGDGWRAAALCKELRPDLVLMDLFMPRCGGLEATRRIRAETPGARIVILTVSAEDQDLFEAIKGGAEGYLVKDVTPEDLARLLRGIWAGEPAISPTLAGRILHEMARGGRPRPVASAPNPLSPREQEVLEQVAAGQTNKEIAEALGVSEHTVKKHLSSVLAKLHLQSRVEAAVYALRQGIAPGEGSTRVPRSRPGDPPKTGAS